MSNRCYAVRDTYACEAVAWCKCILTYICNGVTNCNTRKAFAILERIISYAFYAIEECHAFKIEAAAEQAEQTEEGFIEDTSDEETPDVEFEEDQEEVTEEVTPDETEEQVEVTISENAIEEIAEAVVEKIEEKEGEENEETEWLFTYDRWRPFHCF